LRVRLVGVVIPIWVDLSVGEGIEVFDPRSIGGHDGSIIAFFLVVKLVDTILRDCRLKCHRILPIAKPWTAVW
jgi:hypothetical protein